MNSPDAEKVDLGTLIQQANTCIKIGKIDLGLEVFEEILNQIPKNIEALSGSGVAESLRGNHEKAIDFFEKAHIEAPQEAQILQNLGHACMAVEQPAKAREAFEKAFHIDKKNSETAYWIAQLSEQLGDYDMAETFYEHSLEANPDNVQNHLQLGNVLFLQKKNLEALQVLRSAEKKFPNESSITFLRDRLVSKSVPGWHLPMIEDTERNDAFEAAIKAKVKKDDIVLDIGTGSGLLAMMAIKAGARHVYACEVDPILSALAVEVVLKNGMEDKITIISKHSTSLIIGEDMPEKADVLVTETFDSVIIGEGAIPAILHAHENLLKENPRVIPEGATLYGALVQCPNIRCFKEVDTISDFDLTPMNILTQPYSHKDIQLFWETSQETCAISKTFTIKQFNFQKPPEVDFQEKAAVSMTENGRADAVRMWFELQLAPGVTFSTEHNKSQYHWRPATQLLRQNIVCESGEMKTLDINFQEFFNFKVS